MLNFTIGKFEINKKKNPVNFGDFYYKKIIKNKQTKIKPSDLIVIVKLIRHFIFRKTIKNTKTNIIFEVIFGLFFGN